MPYYTYILASLSHRVYTGVTNDLWRRVAEHRAGLGSRHTHRYRITRLVYYEAASTPEAAIAREKQIKSWTRAKRVALIETTNAGWFDLAASWPAPADVTAGPSLRSG